MKESQRKIIMLLCAGTALVFVLAAFAMPRRARSELPVLAAPRTEAAPASEGKYIVRDYGGRLAVYRVSEPDRPVYLLDVYTGALPEADRSALQEGILLHTEEELSQLLEDYGS